MRNRRRERGGETEGQCQVNSLFDIWDEPSPKIEDTVKAVGSALRGPSQPIRGRLFPIRFTALQTPFTSPFCHSTCGLSRAELKDPEQFNQEC